MKFLYLISLEGQGDETKTLVDQETWDWIHSPRPTFVNHSAREMETLPASVREALEEDEHFDGVFVTSGTCENDRAIAAPGVKLGGVRASFGSTMRLLAFVRANDIDIVDEYHGCIY